MKKTIKDYDVTGRRVLVRVDFNVPIEEGIVTNAARIHAALPTIQYLIERQARVILLTHLGNPEGSVVEALRVDPVARSLADLLRVPVAKVNNCIGPEVHDVVKTLTPGQVLMLENVRFHPGEMVNDQHFAARLASFADLFVNDAFGAAHRSHASTTGIARFLPSAAGLLMEHELQGIQRLHGEIHPPIVVLLGGNRLVEKAQFMEFGLRQGWTFLLGGSLANTFLRAAGKPVGQSTVEIEGFGLARSLLEDYSRQIHLPVDLVIAQALSVYAVARVSPAENVPPDWCIFDIGPETIIRYRRALDAAGTVIWSGPTGAVEFPAFSNGTEQMAGKIASLENAFTIAGGADTVAALDKTGHSSKIKYLSTGGAAFLDALKGKSLPGVEAIEDRENGETLTSSASSPLQSGPAERTRENS